MKSDTTISDSHDSTALGLGQQLAEVLLIVLVFFVVAGDPPPHVNEAHYLARMKHFWNPAWGAGDFFLGTREAHLTLVWLFGWTTGWLSLTATAWVGRALVWTLLAWAWQRLSWRVVPRPLAAVLSAALWVALISKAHLAGEWVVGGVEAKCFAYVLVLVALRALVDRQWNRVWLALGAAAAFHVLVGGWSVVVCGGVWLTDQLRDTRRGVRSLVAAAAPMLPGLIGGGLLALAGVLPALALTWGESSELVAESQRIYVFERLPHHLAPLTAAPETLARRLLGHAALLVVLVGLLRANRRRPDDALDLLTKFAWGAALLAAAGMIIELVFWARPVTAAALLRFYWFRLTDFAVPLAVALHAVHWIVACLARRDARAVWPLAAAIALAAFVLAPLAYERAMYLVPPADRKQRNAAAWIDVCQWIDEHTPPDALFITPSYAHSFKWRTGRAEVATWKDVPQDPRGLVEWFGRIRDLFYVEVNGEWRRLGSISRLGTERAIAVARKYGADYIVTSQRSPLALTPVYPGRDERNEEYVVYAVEPAND